MKQSLLLFFLVFTFSFANAQLAMRNDCNNCPKTTLSYLKTDIKVYPNPATNYIEFKNPDHKIKKVIFFNLVGRSIRELEATSGKNTFDVSDLSRGMYLLQLIDKTGKVVTTKRINKR